MITRGTTYQDFFPLDIKEEEIDSLYVTYMQDKDIIIEKDFSEVTFKENGIFVELSQDDTLEFYSTLENDILSKGLILSQVRYVTLNGKAFASEIHKERLGNILREGAI